MRDVVRRGLFALAALACLAVGPACAEKVKVPELSPAEVEQRIAAKTIQVFDCNPRSMYEQAHVPTARWVDLSRLEEKDLPADKSATLLFYCANEH